MKSRAADSLSGASPTPYWLDDAERPAALPGLAALQGPDQADLVVVGGGYFGLWTALLAKERDPDREVLLLEGETCGHAASGRNGGFCEASLTHGFGNGLSRWPSELDTMLEMGRQNLDAIERTVHEHRIDCDFVRAGSFAVATQDYQVAPLREEYDETRSHGMATTWLEAVELRERVDSPTFLAGMHDPDGAIVEPARLAWGLRDACLRSGVRIAEQTPVESLARSGSGVGVHTKQGRVHAQRVVLATNAYPPLLRRLRLMTVPVYDYALMTEPLTLEHDVTVTASTVVQTTVSWTDRETGTPTSGSGVVCAATVACAISNGVTITFAATVYPTGAVYEAQVGALSSSAMTLTSASGTGPTATGTTLGAVNLPAFENNGNGVTTSSAVAFVHATAGTGMGTFSVAPGVTVTWDPNNTWGGSAVVYSTTAQYAITSGP